MKKVTGIGGIFFKCNDPSKMNEWYKTHLGLDTNEYGATFEWKEVSDSTKIGSTQWNLLLTVQQPILNRQQKIS